MNLLKKSEVWAHSLLVKDLMELLNLYLPQEKEKQFLQV
jgi:hypothetical protein